MMLCRYAKQELNAKKEDEVQDPNAVLFHLQRRCRADNQNETAIRISEGAQRMSRPGPILSLLGHLYGSGQKQEYAFQMPEQTYSRPNSEVDLYKIYSSYHTIIVIVILIDLIIITIMIIIIIIALQLTKDKGP